MKKQEYKIKEYETFTIVEGSSNVIISAPHTYNHRRNGKLKLKDSGTLEIIELIKKITNCHIIYVNRDIDYDPNYDSNSFYKKELIKYINNNDIEYLIDLHGAKIINTFDVEIGTNYLNNVNNDKDLINNFKKIFKNNGLNKIFIDKKFKSSKSTICHDVNNRCNIKTIQIEINKKYRLVKSANYKKIINSICDMISYLEKRENLDSIDYQKKYDDLLDIKPSYGYERDVKPVTYDQIGLEIEVAVNYERKSYTFIGKLLGKIKELVDEKGYFVKDGTIIGDYSFEIVLDPMNVQEIYDFYTDLKEIIKFSNGMIEISSEKKCGIHLNFNKYDILDLSKAHKKITYFASENPKYFDENLYKQFKFLWDYNKYIDYQHKIGDKYLWINYLKTKIVEIRNVKADISPEELVFILTNCLSCLYYDKKEEIKVEETYITIDKLYDAAFENNRGKALFETIKNNGFVILGVENGKSSLIELPDDLNNKIKDYIKETTKQ